jgi:hypothetical protein
MEDLTEPPSILIAQTARERFGEGIADRVGVTQAFAFDELDRVIGAFQRRQNETIHSAGPW